MEILNAQHALITRQVAAGGADIPNLSVNQPQEGAPGMFNQRGSSFTLPFVTEILPSEQALVISIADHHVGINISLIEQIITRDKRFTAEKVSRCRSALPGDAVNSMTLRLAEDGNSLIQSSRTVSNK